MHNFEFRFAILLNSEVNFKTKSRCNAPAFYFKYGGGHENLCKLQYVREISLSTAQLAPSKARMFKVPPQPEESTCASKCFLLTEMRFALQQDLLPRKRPEGVGGRRSKAHDVALQEAMEPKR
jgi:hypothetical protein